MLYIWGMIIKVKRFGESIGCDNIQWYENTDGVRKMCDESTIELLHENWINLEDSTRADDKDFTIFVFGSPFEINI